MTVTIYALFDPRAPEALRYVGATRNARARLGHHNGLVRGSTSPLDAWRRDVILANVGGVRMRVLEEGPAELEAAWLVRLRAEGHDLLNASAVGMGTRGNAWTAVDPGLRAMASRAAKEAGVDLPKWLEAAVAAHLRHK